MWPEHRKDIGLDRMSPVGLDCASALCFQSSNGLQLPSIWNHRAVLNVGLVPGCCVHGVRPRGVMAGSGEGAGCVHMTTGVVGRCWNTGRWVGTGETK